MNHLSTPQETILKAAITREDGSIHPLPSHIKGGAAKKVIASLQAKGLVGKDETIMMDALMVFDPDFKSERGRHLSRIEAEEKARQEADEFAATQGMAWDWQIQTDEAPATTAPETNETPATAIEVEPFPATELETASEPPSATTLETNTDFEEEVIAAEQTIAKAPKARENTKKAKVIEMLKRPEGVTATQIAEATGWQGHTIRSFLSTANKKLGLNITTNRLREVGPNKQGSPGSFTTYFAQ